MKRILVFVLSVLIASPVSAQSTHIFADAIATSGKDIQVLSESLGSVRVTITCQNKKKQVIECPAEADFEVNLSKGRPDSVSITRSLGKSGKANQIIFPGLLPGTYSAKLYYNYPRWSADSELGTISVRPGVETNIPVRAIKDNSEFVLGIIVVSVGLGFLLAIGISLAKTN